MKKILKIAEFWVITLLALAVCFFLIGIASAHAATLYTSETAYNTTLNIGNTADPNKKKAFEFYATSTFALDSIVLDACPANSPVDQMRVKIANSTSSSATIIATSTPLTVSDTCDGVTDTTFQFANEAITGGANYWIILERTGSLDDTNYWNAKGYAGAGYGNRLGNSASGGFTAIAGTGPFEVYQGVPTNAITISYPSTATSTSVFFANWTTNLTMTTSTTATSTYWYSVVIYTANSSSTLSYSTLSELNQAGAKVQGNIQTDCDFYACTTDGVSYLQTLPVPNYMNLEQDTAFYAKALLLFYEGGTTSIVAESDIYAFNTNNASIADTIYNPIYGYNATSTDSQYECTWSTSPANWVNCLVNGVQKSAEFLLTPHDLSMSVFKGAFASFKTTFPFVLFYQYTDAVQSAITSAEGNSGNYDMVLSLPGHGSATLLTSSTLENAIGTENKDLVFTIIETVLWIGTGATLIAIIAI